MSERIKLADLTLGQIKELKSETAKIISQCIADVINVLNERYDVGDIGVEVYTDVDVIKDDFGNILHKVVSYETSITFSNEEDY